jgi:hypothetical protein
MAALYGGTNDVITTAVWRNVKRPSFVTSLAMLKQQLCHSTNDIMSLDSHLSMTAKKDTTTPFDSVEKYEI